MSKTGKAVLIFTSIMGLMGVAMYFIYRQATKSTTASASNTNAYLTDLANVFSGITKAFDNSSAIPASAWAGGSSNSGSSYSYPSLTSAMPDSSQLMVDDSSDIVGSYDVSVDSYDSSDSVDTSEA